MCTGSHQYRNITFETLMNGCIGCCDVDTSILPFCSASITPRPLPWKPHHEALLYHFVTSHGIMWLMDSSLGVCNEFHHHTSLTYNSEVWCLKNKNHSHVHSNIRTWLADWYLTYFILISILNNAYFKSIECKYMYCRNN